MNSRIKNIDAFRKDIQFDSKLLDCDLNFTTTWGLFSPERIDDGTYLLLQNTEVSDSENILDIGCGYGPIGVTLAKKHPSTHVDMVDKDFVAVDYSNKNIQNNRVNNAKAFLSNGLSHIPQDAKYDIILSNLPAKASNEMYWVLFDDVKHHLSEGGRFYIVTISGLKEFVKRSFKETFGNYKKVAQNKTYTVSLAIKE
jgi:16S rRNA (guanine1207-N2)-methyltransferase